MPRRALSSFIQGIPKTELHLHLEGTFEPELMFEIAQRNQVRIPFNSVDDVKKAYHFNNLQEFLDIYYKGAQVLRKKQDFFDLTMAYLQRVHAQNVRHVEVFFDPQTHTDRGVPFSVVIEGIRAALETGNKDFGISYKLIMCFLRHLSEAEAHDTLLRANDYRQWIYGVGLDSSEVGHPPSKFKHVFNEARRKGYRIMAHAGEEGPPDYIWEAIDLLQVERIDHGNRCLEDENLVSVIANKKLALTLCPLSNKALKVIESLEDYPLLQMIDLGLLVTINSDDPAYFGGYLNENYQAVADALELTRSDILLLAKNSVDASFLEKDEKMKLHQEIDAFVDDFKIPG